MADKLSGSSWANFTKRLKLELDDKALTKALAAFDKTSEDKHEPRLAALDETIEQIKKQVTLVVKRKKELGDKTFDEVKAKLYELLDAAETLHAETTRAAKNAKQAASDEDDEEESSPALLTTQMIPLIRQLRKGEVRYSALIGAISKTAAVLISKRTISNSRRKLLSEALDAAGGVKFFKGECYYADKTLFFAMEGPVSGLAKRVRAALLEQTGFRLKVKMTGDDGADEDGQEEEEEGAGAASGAPQAPPAPTPEELAYMQRLQRLRDPLTKALSALHPEATKMRALMAFAAEKADQRNFAPASQALDALLKLLSADAPAAGSGAPKGNGAELAMSAWAQQRGAAVTSLKDIAARIAAARHPRSAPALLQIKAVIANLTPEPKTLQQVNDLERWLATDAVVRDICALDQDLRTPLLQALGGLRAAISA